MGTTAKRTRSERLEVRTTVEERALIDRAVIATGGDLTEFVTISLTISARRVLADRTVLELHEDGQAAWDEINQRPARDLAGLRALMARPSPFTTE